MDQDNSDSIKKQKTIYQLKKHKNKQKTIYQLKKHKNKQKTIYQLNKHENKQKTIYQLKKHENKQETKYQKQNRSIYFKGRNFHWKKLSRFRDFWPVSRKFLPRNFSKSLNHESLFPRNFQNLSTTKFLFVNFCWSSLNQP